MEPRENEIKRMKEQIRKVRTHTHAHTLSHSISRVLGCEVTKYYSKMRVIDIIMYMYM